MRPLPRARLPPIERSPFSAPLHSLRRLNQFEWQDGAGAAGAVPGCAVRRIRRTCSLRMEEENRDAYPAAGRGAGAVMRTRASWRRRRLRWTLAREAAAASRTRTETCSGGCRTSAITCFDEGLRSSAAHRISSAVRWSGCAADLLTQQRGLLHPRDLRSCRSALIVALIAPLVPRHAFWSGDGCAAAGSAAGDAGRGGPGEQRGDGAAAGGGRCRSSISPRAFRRRLTTLVVVPTLLLNEQQVREIVLRIWRRGISRTRIRISTLRC